MSLIVQGGFGASGRPRATSCGAWRARSVRSAASPHPLSGGITNRNFRVTPGRRRLRDPAARQGHRPARHRPRPPSGWQPKRPRSWASPRPWRRRSRTAWSRASSCARPVQREDLPGRRRGDGAGAAKLPRLAARGCPPASACPTCSRTTPRSSARGAATLPGAYSDALFAAAQDHRRPARRGSAALSQRPARGQHHPRRRATAPS